MSSTSSNLGSSEALPSFTLFSKLPLELRLHIWQLALTPRLIRLSPGGGKTPSVMNTCTESRNELRKRYRLCILMDDTLTNELANSNNDGVPRSFGVFINYEIDVFHLSSLIEHKLRWYENHLILRNLNAVVWAAEHGLHLTRFKRVLCNIEDYQFITTRRMLDYLTKWGPCGFRMQWENILQIMAGGERARDQIVNPPGNLPVSCHSTRARFPRLKELILTGDHDVYPVHQTRFAQQKLILAHIMLSFEEATKGKKRFGAWEQYPMITFLGESMSGHLSEVELGKMLENTSLLQWNEESSTGSVEYDGDDEE